MVRIADARKGGKIKRKEDAGTPGRLGRQRERRMWSEQLTSTTELGGADRYSHPNTTRPKSNRRNKIGGEKREDTIKVSAISIRSVVGRFSAAMQRQQGGTR
jgi:hypothetical protein